MSLEAVAKELESYASFKGVDLLIEHNVAEHCFIPVINEYGKVGAIGNYLDNGKSTLGFFILNDRVVKYALEEGFEVDHIYDCFKKKLFKELKKEEFFQEMVEKVVD